MEGIDLSEQVLSEVLESHRKRSVASRVAQVAWEVAEGSRDFSELPTAIEEAEREIPKPVCNIQFVTDDLEELYNATYGQPGWKWKLLTLRKMMGSLRKGDFGFLYARPEVGKTTFLADQCSHFARQGATVLHFNNEETDRKIKIRYYQATLNVTSRELFSDFRGNTTKFLEETGGRVKIVPDELSRHRADIEAVIEETTPDIIVIDSIDKVEGFENDREDLKYKAVYGWARRLAIKHAPIIGVCHASVSGEGKKYLEMDDVAYAKTAKQAEADWILGIGKSNDPNDGEYLRYFHLPKNKLMGDDEMDEEFRHGRLQVRIFPEVAQFDDVLSFG